MSEKKQFRGRILSDKQVIDLLNEMDSRTQELEKENQRLNAKVNRLTDELANCYEKLGW